MINCINTTCEDYDSDEEYNCADCSGEKYVLGCANYASHAVAVRFKGATKKYEYFTKFQPCLGETLIVYPRGERTEVTVVNILDDSDKATHFAERPAVKKRLEEVIETPAWVQNMNNKTKGANIMKFEILDKTKDSLIKAQVGSAVIEATKKMLTKTPMPTQVTEFLSKPGYGDAVVGILVEAMARHFTTNQKVLRAAECARVTGITRMSEEITFIKDIITEISKAFDGVDALDSKE